VPDLLILCSLYAQKAHDNSITALICTDDNLFSSSYTIIKVVLVAFGQIISLSVSFLTYILLEVVKKRPSDPTAKEGGCY